MIIAMAPKSAAPVRPIFNFRLPRTEISAYVTTKINSAVIIDRPEFKNRDYGFNGWSQTMAIRISRVYEAYIVVIFSSQWALFIVVFMVLLYSFFKFL